MPNPDAIWSRRQETVYPSNVPLSFAEISGWLRVERGELHVFLVDREQGEYGKRHYIMTLKPGDVFAGGEFQSFDDMPGREYGYLLVPQEPVRCRVLTATDWNAVSREYPEAAAELRTRFVRALSSSCAGEGDAGTGPAEQEKTEVSEILPVIIRKTLAAISKRETAAEEHVAAERLYRENRLQEQMLRLRDIVHPRRRRSSTADPLSAALEVIAEENNLRIFTGPPEDSSADPEQRLIEFCRTNQWRFRRIQLDGGFSRLHHRALIGFYGPEARPCVMELDGDDSVWYFPGTGEKHPLKAAQEAELRNFAYCFYENLPLRPLSRGDLVRFLLRGGGKPACCILAVGVLVGLFGLVTPVATAYVTGKIIPTANTGELRQLLILLLSLSLGTVILNAVPQLCLLLFGASALERFMAALFDRLFRLPVAFFQRHRAGDLCTRLFSVVRLQELMFQVVSQQFLGAVFGLCSVIMLGYYSWRLTLVAVPLVLGYGWLLFFLFMRLERPLRTAADMVGRESGFLKQVFDGIGKIRSAGAEGSIENRFLDDFIAEKRARDRYFAGAGAVEVIGIVMPAVMNLLFYYLIGKVWRGSLELSGFLAFLSAYGNFQIAVITIGESFWLLASRKPELDRLKIFWETEVESPEGKPQAGRLDGSLEFSHVTFGYEPEAPPVLRDVSFAVRPGEFAAIVGPSGAGKSSLVRLMLGFECPGNGSILYSGQDLRELDVHSVRRQLGVILQNSRIMPGSILENIATGVDCSPEAVAEALRLAALDQDIAAMPMGIYTNVSEGVLSGGQQQRILIARALIGSPAIIIMDESTSALDNETQEAVRRNIEQLNVTRIVIAHRLSTIIHADRIYVLEKGKIRESGTFAELMSRDGAFRRLARRQMLEEEEKGKAELVP